ncbi:helix-turn-helix transcriptional regulator [Paenibacillus sp. YSY-4.3]
MTVTNSKAKAMGMFLKSRRERLSPEDAGLEFTSGQRKTPGLRREEVAVLAGVSVTYYTWLEQGRDLTPSRDVIDCIAQALRLSPAEKSHLYQLWNPHASETPLATRAVVDPQIQQIIDQLAFPSHITNERTEVLAWNKAAQEMFFDFASIPVQERYFIRLLFEDTEMRSRIVNIEHLIKNNAEFERIWKQYDVQLKKVNRIFLQPPGVYQSYDIQSLVNLTDSPDIHICIYTPITDDPAADC